MAISTTPSASCGVGEVPRRSNRRRVRGGGFVSGTTDDRSSAIMIFGGLGWVISREITQSELVDGTQPRWFNYGTWRFFMRFVAPVAVAAILIAVIFFGVDFS